MIELLSDVKVSLPESERFRRPRFACGSHLERPPPAKLSTRCVALVSIITSTLFYPASIARPPHHGRGSSTAALRRVAARSRAGRKRPQEERRKVPGPPVAETLELRPAALRSERARLQDAAGRFTRP